MKRILVGNVWALSLLWSSHSQAQTATADSSSLATTVSRLNQRYATTVGYESGLFNGPEYISYVKAYVQGHPFFEAATNQEGTVEYGGATYRGVKMRYDLIRGQVVLPAPLGALSMRLVNERVKRFTLAGHTFIRIVTDSTTKSEVSTGFYDLLVDGPAQLLASRRKGLQERSTTDGMVGEIRQRNEYFVRKGGRYYQVSSANSVLKLFPEQKAALRKYSRTQKLNFGAAGRENALADLVRYQGTLPPVATAAAN